MRQLPSSLLVACVACGPAHVFHKDPERGCADVSLAGQEDVAAAAGCPAIESLTIRTGMSLDLKPLARLSTIRGAIAVGPTVGVSEVALPRLREAGSIRIVGNGDLHGVFFPLLERAGAVEIEGNNKLTTISLPKLATVTGRVSIVDDPALELIDLSVLATAGEILISNNPKLSLVEGTLPALQAAVPANHRPEHVPPIEP
jgi:hypothetical protein